MCSTKEYEYISTTQVNINLNKMQKILIISLLLISVNLFGQSSDTTISWDNQLFLGNKIAINKNNWRFSGELQVRLKNNTQSLDNYFFEGVASYMISKKWEIVPDFRMTIKPDDVEYRPGFGVVYKVIKNKFQFVNQLKLQTDFSAIEPTEYGVRYALFFNWLIDDKYIPNFAVGIFYRWKDNFNGVQFVRFGPGLAYLINVQHSLNFNYLISVKNYGNTWGWAGIPVIQLVININKDYKYVPAKYFNF